ncbi:MAG: FadR/GntR family transcriptional regulator [Planctomycetota bacterium]|jgi:GntR family transcriptional repressor for pyruvate dehydrogenase complex
MNQEAKQENYGTAATANAILKYIKEKKIVPGNFIPTEAELLEICGVSRNALREALSYLKGLGILQSRQGSGVKLAEVDPFAAFESSLSIALNVSKPDITGVMETRKIMELGAIKLAVNKATDSDISAVREVFDRLEKIYLTDKYSWEDYNRTDAELHCAMMKPAGCRLLSMINNIVMEYFKIFRAVKATPADWKAADKESYIEHQILAKAFELKNPELAYATLEKHLKLV